MTYVTVSTDVDLHDFVDSISERDVDECMALLRGRVIDRGVAGKSIRTCLIEIRDAAARGENDRALDLAVALAVEYTGAVDLRPAATLRRAA
jgi:hypothetical protein